MAKDNSKKGPKKKALGKGLSALIPENMIEIEDSSANQEGAVSVSIDKVMPNGDQPRKQFDKEKLKELSDSIKEHGVIQPIVVVEDGDKYIIVAGERRFKASLLAELKEVPIIIKDFNEEQVLEVALIENLQREDLNEIEKADAYKQLGDNHNMTQENIAKKLGKSRASVANTLRLLTLTDKIKEMIKKDAISAGHARAILSVDEKNREDFANHIISKKLSVREAEALSKEYTGEKIDNKTKVKEDTTEEDPYVKDVEDKLSLTFGTKVKIKDKKGSGKIEIEYFSAEDLNRILSLIDLSE